MFIRFFPFFWVGFEQTCQKTSGGYLLRSVFKGEGGSNFDLVGVGVAKFNATTPWGSPCCARSLCGFGVHFLARAKKRTKKARLGASP
jgi:hypothetical protein